MSPYKPAPIRSSDSSLPAAKLTKGFLQVSFHSCPFDKFHQAQLSHTVHVWMGNRNDYFSERSFGTGLPSQDLILKSYDRQGSHVPISKSIVPNPAKQVQHDSERVASLLAYQSEVSQLVQQN